MNSHCEISVHGNLPLDWLIFSTKNFGNKKLGSCKNQLGTQHSNKVVKGVIVFRGRLSKKALGLGPPPPPRRPPPPGAPPGAPPPPRRPPPPA